MSNGSKRCTHTIPPTPRDQNYPAAWTEMYGFEVDFQRMSMPPNRQQVEACLQNPGPYGNTYSVDVRTR
jgi:hypothetical protein